MQEHQRRNWRIWPTLLLILSGLLGIAGAIEVSQLRLPVTTLSLMLICVAVILMRLPNTDYTSPNPSIVIKTLTVIGISILLYATVKAVITMVTAPTWDVGLVSRVDIGPWPWGEYLPHSYAVIIQVGVFVVFLKKFGWYSLFAFLFVWGTYELAYNMFYSIYHLQDLLGSAIAINGVYPWSLDPTFPLRIMIVALGAAIGAAVMHLKFDLKANFTLWFGLALYLGTIVYLYSIGFPVVTIPRYSNMIVLHFLEMVGSFAWPLFIFSAMRPRTSTMIEDEPIL